MSTMATYKMSCRLCVSLYACFYEKVFSNEAFAKSMSFFGLFFNDSRFGGDIIDSV